MRAERWAPQQQQRLQSPNSSQSGMTFSTRLEGGAMSSTYQVGGDHVHHEAGRRSDSLCGARKQSDILSRVRKWSDVIKEVELHQS